MTQIAKKLTFTALDIDTMARTIYGEARGESRAGQVAVAYVILNRASRPSWWSRGAGPGIPDDTIAAVCRRSAQFSCWNTTDPNLKKLLAASAADPVFAGCLSVVAEVLSGVISDPTGRADHYHHHAITAAWSKGVTPTAVIGNHKFFRLT